MKKIKGKGARQLPSRGALNDLGKTRRTIADYGKVSPATEVQPSVLQTLVKRKP